MASSYSELKIQLMATGENDGTWGDITNVNFLAFQQMITGQTVVNFASADVVLTLVDTNALQQARAFRLVLTGVTGGVQRTLTIPALPSGKAYVVFNTCADPILVKTPAGAGVVVPGNNRSILLYEDGNNVLSAHNFTPDFFANTITTSGSATILGGLAVGGTTTSAGPILGGQYIEAPAIRNNARGIVLTSDNVNGANIHTDVTNARAFSIDWASGNLYYGNGGTAQFTWVPGGDYSIARAFSSASVATGIDRKMTLASVADNYAQFHMNSGPSALVWHCNIPGKSVSWFTDGGERMQISNVGIVTAFGGFSTPGSITATGNITGSGQVGNNGRGVGLSSDGSTYSRVIFDNQNQMYFHDIWSNNQLWWYAGNAPVLSISASGTLESNADLALRGGVSYRNALNSGGAAQRINVFLQGPESAGNVGNDLNFYCYDNAGTFTGTAAQIKRSTNRFIAFGGMSLEMQSGAGGNFQFKIDGVARWMHSVEAGSGNFSLLALNTSGVLASEILRANLSTFTLTHGNNSGSIFLKPTGGSWFSGPAPITLTSTQSSIAFEAGSGTNVYLSSGNGDGGLYMGQKNGNPAQFTFNTLNGVGSATTWSSTSDVRLKYNIVPLSIALDALTDLQPFTYLQTLTEEDAVNHVNGTFGAGVIAQDLIGSPFENLVIQPLPNQFGTPDFLSFNYAGLTAWYIAAFKEVKARLEASEAQMTSVLARLDALEA